MSYEMRIKVAQAYIMQIRNPLKRDYAWSYLRFKLDEANQFEPCWGKLSYMAAQAVRMRIAEFLAS